MVGLGVETNATAQREQFLVAVEYRVNSFLDSIQILGWLPQICITM